MPKVNRRRNADLSFSKVIYFVVATVVAASLLVRLLPTTIIFPRQKSSSSAVTNLLKIEILPDEQRFLSSVKSCLPSESGKCKTYVPEPSPGTSKKVHRVAILSSSNLAPPRQEHIAFAPQDVPDLDVSFRASVPPYGYGKTHGLTKIVRWQHQPLLQEATHALQRAVVEANQSDQTIITLADLKAALRQVLRFHCRLSHVSAHTAILSVRSLSADPAETTATLKSFLIPTPESTQNAELDALVKRLVDEEQQSYSDAQKFGSNLLSDLQASSGVNVRDVLNTVLLDEVNRTKRFSAWPCLSFWAAGEDSNPLDISPMVQRIARALSPDCSDSQSNCWVGRDKCEARGDGACRDS